MDAAEAGVFYHNSTVPITGKQQGIFLVGENILSQFVQGWQRATNVPRPLDQGSLKLLLPGSAGIKMYIYI